VYAGTASKSLGPALRLSWLVVPEALRRDLLHVTQVRAGVSAIDQLALADFVRRGDLDRQVRHTRTRYRRRRDQLTEVLAAEASWLEVTGTAAGLHLMATIADPHLDEAVVLHAAEERSVGLAGLRTHHRSVAVPPGFAIGFSRPAQHRFTHALEQLAGVLRTVSSRG
jgi:GntR family transcriptional regulator/MocR family aminotransferase